MRNDFLRRNAAPITALFLVCAAYLLTRYPYLSQKDAEKLASEFRFKKLALAEIPNAPAYKNVRAVHPSLTRISAWVSSLGAAATFADLDGDGLSNDLVHVDPRTDLVTVAPAPDTGTRFAAFSLTAGTLPYSSNTMAPMGSLVGDFNEDGRSDILVYFWGRTPIIYLRNSEQSPLSNTSYTAIELTMSGERWFSNGAVQADLDGDGHIDLLIGNYFQDGAQILDAKATGIEKMHEGKAKALNGGFKHVFLWKAPQNGTPGDLMFAERKDVFPDEIARGWTLAIGVADIDGDQLTDIYFGNDFGPDRLLHNRSTPGNLKFVELEGKRDFTTPKSCVLGFDSFKGMGCDFGDVNGDGLFDIYVSNIATKFGLTESHFLWQSTGKLNDIANGGAPYFQNSERLGLSRSGWGWDCRLADFNNDGVVEAIQAVGFIKGSINRWPELQALGTSNSSIVHDPRVWPSFKPGADLSGKELNPFFVLANDGRYYDIAKEVGLTEPMVSRGIAMADVDGDGRLDFAFANQWEPSFFYRNEAPSPGAFMGLHLVLPLSESSAPLFHRSGHPGNDISGRPAFGAQAIAHLPNGKKILGQIDGGSGHSGRRSPEILLGLGDVKTGELVRVEIKWRDVSGVPRKTELRLKSGWHTVRLN